MKKFMLLGFVALAFASCGNDIPESFQAPAGYQNDATVAQYENAFKATFGVPDPNQTWGFGNPVNPVNAMRRSMASPNVPTISAPYDETWVANYLTTATEPNSTNVNHNYDNGTTFGWANYIYNGIANDADYDWFVEYCQQAVNQNW